MKILSILNVSNRENIGSDSGVIFHKLLFPECIREGHEIVVASPFEAEIDGAVNVFHEPGKSKYDVRFRFDWDRNKELIELTRPDIIFCHQIEQCANLRALLITLGLSDKVKLVTYYHYLPALAMEGSSIVWDPSLNHEGLAELILFKVLSALKSADIFFVTSQYSRDFLSVLANHYHVGFDKDRVVVMPPPADPFFELGEPVQFSKNKTVLYSSRLYEQYGTDFLLEIIDHYKGSDVKFVITDFFANKSIERRSLDTKTEQYRNLLRQHDNIIVRDDGDIRKVYRDQILRSSTIVFGPFRKNANWSMGMVDAFMMGIPGIGPNFASFPEFMPPHLIYSDKNSAISLIDRLLDDEIFWNESAKVCRESYSDFMPHRVAEIFLKAINE